MTGHRVYRSPLASKPYIVHSPHPAWDVGPNVKDVAIRDSGSAAEKRDEEVRDGGRNENV